MLRSLETEYTIYGVWLIASCQYLFDISFPKYQHLVLTMFSNNDENSGPRITALDTPEWTECYAWHCHLQVPAMKLWPVAIGEIAPSPKKKKKI